MVKSFVNKFSWLRTSDGYSTLLAVRVTKSLFKSLQKGAKKSGLPLSEYVRRILTFPVYPELVKLCIEDGIYEPEIRDAVDRYLEYLEKVEVMSNEVLKVRENALNQKKELEMLRQEFESKWQEMKLLTEDIKAPSK